MGEPPSLPGAEKLITAPPSCALALPMIGASGAPSGVTLTLADDGPVPTLLLAVTLQLCTTPFASPVTTIGEAIAEATMAPGLQVAV